MSYSYCYYDLNSASVVINALSPGYCNVTFSNVNKDFILYVNDLVLQPGGSVIPPTPSGATFTLGYTPTSYISQELFRYTIGLSDSITLRSPISPSITSPISKTTLTSTLSQIQINSILSLTNYDSTNRYKKAELEVVLGSSSYSVAQGVIFYNTLNSALISTSPNLIRLNELTTISLSTSTPTFTDTGSLVVSLCGSLFNSSDGSITVFSDSLVRVTASCSNSIYQNSIVSLGYSQDGGITFTYVSMTVFEVNSISITYDTTGSCSIFGKNNFTMSFGNSLFNSVNTGVITLSIVEQPGANDDTFTCQWISSSLTCPCPYVWDQVFNPPKEFPFFLRPITFSSSYSDQMPLRSAQVTGIPKILFGDFDRPYIQNPIGIYSFNVTSPAIYNSLQIQLVNTSVIYVPDKATYAFYLSSSPTADGIVAANQINCTWNSVDGSTVTCDYASLVAKRPSLLNSLCGCNPYTVDSRSGDGCIPACYLYVIFAIYRQYSTTPSAYYTKNTIGIIPPIYIKSIVPDSTLAANFNSLQYSVSTSTSSFVDFGKTVNYKWVQVASDGSETGTFYQGTATYASRTSLSLSSVGSVPSPVPGTYVFKLSLDGTDGYYSKDGGVRRLNIIDVNTIHIDYFEQFTFNASVAVPSGYDKDTIAPVATNYRIIGSGFPLSETVTVKLSISGSSVSVSTRKAMKRLSRNNLKSHLRHSASTQEANMINSLMSTTASGEISFLSDCTTYSTTEIRCTSPNLLSSGISLPLAFNTTISFDGSFGPAVYSPMKNGSNYQVTVRASEVPVIVQAIPSKGPINPSDDTKGVGYLTITLKGITTDVNKCTVRHSVYNFLSANYTAPSGSAISKEEFKCIIDAYALNDSIALYNSVQTDPSQLVTYPSKSFEILLYTSTALPSTAFAFEFFEYPLIQSITPIEIDAKGGNSITLTADRSRAPFDSSYSIYFKVGDFTSDTLCSIVGNDNYVINCTNPSHPDGVASASIS